MDDISNLEIVPRFRARNSSNRILIDLLSRNTTEKRVKRIISLLEAAVPYGEEVDSSFHQISGICDEFPINYRGFHPHLIELIHELETDGDYLLELLKRVLLYLDNMKSVGTQVSPTTIQLVNASVTEQKQLTLQILQNARLTVNKQRCPGPAPLPHGGMPDTVTGTHSPFRKLLNGEPQPIGDNYDARWDPDLKVPGSQYGKFLRFPGPFFDPSFDPDDKFDRFCLPASAGDLLDLWKSRYKDTTVNLIRTGRVKNRGQLKMDEEDEEDEKKIKARQEFKAMQKEVGVSLAKGSGETYNPESTMLLTRRREQNIIATAGPYLTSSRMVASSRQGTGYWAFEDTNRVMKMEMAMNRMPVPPMDIGSQIFFDRSMNRNAE